MARGNRNKQGAASEDESQLDQWLKELGDKVLEEKVPNNLLEVLRRGAPAAKRDGDPKGADQPERKLSKE